MKYLYRIYTLFIAVPIILIATILTCITTVIGCTLGNGHFWGYHPGRIWSKVICRALLLKIEVEGRQNIDSSTSYVFVANHQGSFDIFLIYGYLGRNFKWMMKKSLRKMPLVGKASEAAGHIFVDKSGPKKIAQTQEHARKTLQGGTSLVVFPEGARSFTGHMGFFRKGAFQLASQLHLQIVPLTIDGSFDVLARTSLWPSHHKMKLTIHKPITCGESTEEIKKSMDESYNMIESALPERHKGYVENTDQ